MEERTRRTIPHSRRAQIEAFERLLDVLDELREKCPWDRKQTNQSLRPNTIEEVYELSDALLSEDDEEICKELGDVLLHVIFYAKIGSEKGTFDIKEVCDKLCDKLIFRHPHIFSNKEVESAEEVANNWEELKLKEKGGNKRVLSGVPTSLPSLIKAFRIQEKARNIGFDWEQREDVFNKVKEEYYEFKEELIKDSNAEHIEDEFGDLLFSLVNVGRLYNIDPDTALEKTNKRFIRRFNFMEDHTLKEGIDLKDLSFNEKNKIWDQAKKEGL